MAKKKDPYTYDPREQPINPTLPFQPQAAKMPEVDKPAETKKAPLSPQFKPEGSGVLKTIVQPDGSVYLERLKPSQMKQEGIGDIPLGPTAEQQAIEAQNQQAQAEAQIPQIYNELGQLGLNNVSPQQGEGLVGGVATGVAGAGGLIGGALGGAAIAGPVGAIVGGVVGGLGTTFSKISLSQRQDVKQAYSVYTAAAGNMAAIINSVNQGKMSQAQAILRWREELSNFHAAESNLKKLTAGNLDRFLSGGTDELRKLEGFRRTIPDLQLQLARAIAQPNPNSPVQLFNEAEE